MGNLGRALQGQAALWRMCAISSPASTGESDLAEQIKVRLQGEGLLSEIDAFDLLRGGDSHDLSSIALREQIIEDIENKYGIVVFSPPCNTYSRLNWSEDPGPRPIRCLSHASQRVSMVTAALLMEARDSESLH